MLWGGQTPKITWLLLSFSGRGRNKASALSFASCLNSTTLYNLGRILSLNRNQLLYLVGNQIKGDLLHRWVGKENHVAVFEWECAGLYHGIFLRDFQGQLDYISLSTYVNFITPPPPEICLYYMSPERHRWGLMQCIYYPGLSERLIPPRHHAKPFTGINPNPFSNPLH